MKVEVTITKVVYEKKLVEAKNVAYVPGWLGHGEVCHRCHFELESNAVAVQYNDEKSKNRIAFFHDKCWQELISPKEDE